MIDIDYVLRLARIYLKKEEKEKIEKDLIKIVSYFENLNKIDTDKIEPTFHATGNKNVFREDEVKDFKYKDDIIENAPNREDRYFKVKRIIEDI